MPDLTENDGLQVHDVVEGLTRAVNLIHDPDSAAESVLQAAGLNSRAEAHIITQLADVKPLAHPDQFEQAFHLALRALEVYDREGYGSPRIPNIPIIKPVIRLLVVRFGKFVVRSFARDTWSSIRKLIARREAQTRPGSQERVMLRRARIHLDIVGQEFKGGSLGVPGFVIGAGVPLIASLTGGVVQGTTNEPWLIAVGALFGSAFVAALAWIVLRGSGVAHRRATITLTKPLNALWETIGNCGKPPEDDASTFAIGAIALMGTLWIVVPAAVAFSSLSIFR